MNIVSRYLINKKNFSIYGFFSIINLNNRRKLMVAYYRQCLTIFTIILLIIVFSFSFPGCMKVQEKNMLHVFSGTGMVKPMDEIAEMYEKEKGTKVNITYKSGGQSLITMELTKEGDVFFPGSEVFLEDGIKKKFINKNDIRPIAKRIPVIVVQKGNPKGITKLEDLYNGNSSTVSVCLHDKNTTIGKLIRKKVFNKEQMELLEDNVVSVEASLAQVVIKIELGVADAGFGWLSYTQIKDKIEAVRSHELDVHEIKLSIAPTLYAKNYKAASDFIKYVCGEKGKSIFQKYAFTTID